MIETSVDTLADFCEGLGIRGPLQIEPVGNGRNSRVERISNGDGEWILKRYFAPGAQTRDRLAVEYGFLEYLQASGVADVARPLGCDRASHFAIYTKLPGRRVDTITDDHIAQAARFIAAINRDASSAQAHAQALALPRAADACATLGDHLGLVSARLSQFAEMPATTDLEHQVRDWIATRLVPASAAIERSLRAHASAADRIVPILSPSDFGFHNVLDDNGHLSFVDFEYAGWDDPAKLACDFLCQPEIPVSAAHGMQFVDMLAHSVAPGTALVERVALLLPVHRLKWCCILLNEFRAEHRARRLHAGIEADGMLAAQFDKARRYFAQHF